jgi:iron complex outermembrane receptor protein
VNPKGGITWQVTPSAMVYASHGSNGREPTRNDMFAGFDNVDTSNVDFVGPLTRVKPERVYDTELGIRWRAPTIAAALNGFLMEFRNEITPIGELSYIGLPLRKNVASSSRRGVELDVQWRPSLMWEVTANATVSRNRIDEYTDDATGESHRDVEPLLTPTVIANHAVFWRATSALRFDVSGRYVGESFLANTGDDRFTTPAAYLVDAGVAWYLGPSELGVRVMNVTDKRFFAAGYTDGVEPYYFIGSPRAIVATATLRF